MASKRLSSLQRRIQAWLWAKAQLTRGTMATSHQDLVQALAHDKGNLCTPPKTGGEWAGDDHPDARWQGRGGGPDCAGANARGPAHGKLSIGRGSTGMALLSMGARRNFLLVMTALLIGKVMWRYVHYRYKTRGKAKSPSPLSG